MGNKGVDEAKPAGAGLAWGPLVRVTVWLVALAVLYALMVQLLKPPPLVVAVTGELSIPRARDGHFYVQGHIEGKPVTFLVDTGASLVLVTETFAREAGLAAGRPTTFRTASGELRGRIVSGLTVSVGPASISGARVGVGLAGTDPSTALLGQSFLSRFEVVLSGDTMTLRAR